MHVEVERAGEIVSGVLLEMDLVPHDGVRREQMPEMHQRRNGAENEQFRTRACEPSSHAAKITSAVGPRPPQRTQKADAVLTPWRLRIIDRTREYRVWMRQTQTVCSPSRACVSIGSSSRSEASTSCNSETTPTRSRGTRTTSSRSACSRAETGDSTYRGRTWVADEGSILAVSPDQVHTAEPRRDRGWTYCAMYPTRGAHGARGRPCGGRGTGILSGADLSRRWSRRTRCYAVQQRLRAPTTDLATEERLLDVLRLLVNRHAETRGGRIAIVGAVARGRHRA